MPQALKTLLREAESLILDGPTGTALEARGFRSHQTLWTAGAIETDAELLASVHRDYLRAGAQLLTANTFRTTAYAATQAGLPNAEATARRWLYAAVQLLRSCVADFDPESQRRYVVGSLAPLANCYFPRETPDDAILWREHRRTAAWLVDAGCDGILVETQGCGREARIAVAAAVEQAADKLPVLLSLLPDPSGARLLDGDDLLRCAQACLDCGAAAVLVNCAHVEVLLRALEVLRPLGARGVPLGAYPNAAEMHFSDGNPYWIADPQGRRPAAAAAALHRAGARIIGACCGYDAADLAAMAVTIRERE